MVGVDGSPISLSALKWAAREARVRGASLEVVHATFLPHDAMDLHAVAALKARESAILDEAVAKAAALAPAISVVARVLDPPAADALVNVSKDADLLVVGSRGLGPFKEFALGSVARPAHATPNVHCSSLGPGRSIGKVAQGAGPNPVGGTRP